MQQLQKKTNCSVTKRSDSPSNCARSDKKRKRRLVNCKYYLNLYHSDESSSEEDEGPSTKKVTKDIVFDKDYIKDATKIGVYPCKLDFTKEKMNGKNYMHTFLDTL